MKQIIKSLIILFGLSISIISSGLAENVTLPYTFNAGEKAKASEVNANFDVLKKAINGGVTPKLAWTNIDFKGTIGAGGYSNNVVGRVTLNAPSDGYVVVHSDGYARFSDELVHMSLVVSDDEIYDYDAMSDLFFTSLGYSSSNSFSHTQVYEVSVGNHSFYSILLCAGYTSSSPTGVLAYHINGTLTAIFYPTTKK